MDIIVTQDMTEKERNSMRFLLINPAKSLHQNPGMPIGFAIIGALIRDNSLFVEAIDYQVEEFSFDKLKDIIIKDKISIICLTGVTVQAFSAYKIARFIKENFLNIKIIMGGVHASAISTEVLEHGVDIVVKDEGEATFLELLSKQFSLIPSVLKEIKGIAFMNNGEYVETPQRERITDLDSLPIPARELFKYPEHYDVTFHIVPGYSAQIVASRGCPAKCIFCYRIFRDKVVNRSVDNVIAEIIYLRDKYHIKQFDMVDEFFTFNIDWVKDFCNRLIEDKINIKWSANNTRVDSVNREVFCLMKKSGCYKVSFGVESGSPEVLKRLGKGITLDQVVTSIQIVKETGLLSGAFFMIGHHCETEEDILKTIEFAKKLPADAVQFAVNCPYPGTAMRKIFEKKGQILHNDWDQYTTWAKPVYFTDYLTPEKITWYYKKAYRENLLAPLHLKSTLHNLVRNNGEYFYLYFSGFKQVFYRYFQGKAEKGRYIT